MYVIKYLSKQSRSFLMGLAFVLFALLGGTDYFTGSSISLGVFYLVPISLATWFVGKRAGILVSIASAIARFVVDVTAPPYWRSILPYWHVSGELSFFLLFSYTLSALRRALEREKELGRTDYLTGVANRRHFFELLNIEKDRADRYKHCFTVAYIDVDDFKTVNDRFGHNAGDALLNLMAAAIRDNIRAIDVVARLGGDEFVILLPETGHEQAQIVVHRVQESLLDSLQKSESLVTLSIGMVTFVSVPRTVEEILTTVDGIMYSVKDSGKNTIKHEIVDSLATVA